MKDENGKKAEQQPEPGQRAEPNISNIPGLSIDPCFASDICRVWSKIILKYYVEVHVHDLQMRARRLEYMAID